MYSPFNILKYILLGYIAKIAEKHRQGFKILSSYIGDV